MSGNEPDRPLPESPDLTVRLLPPRRRNDEPLWELRLAGEVIGFVQRQTLRGASNAFYLAIGYYPGTAHEISLELSTDFTDRCKAILAFHRDSESSPHIGWQRPASNTSVRERPSTTR